MNDLRDGWACFLPLSSDLTEFTFLWFSTKKYSISCFGNGDLSEPVSPSYTQQIQSQPVAFVCRCTGNQIMWAGKIRTEDWFPCCGFPFRLSKLLFTHLTKTQRFPLSLSFTHQETKWYDETTVELMAPTMLPELHLLKRVKPDAGVWIWKVTLFSNTCCLLQIKVKGPRYWELLVDLSSDTEHLKWEWRWFNTVQHAPLLSDHSRVLFQFVH